MFCGLLGCMIADTGATKTKCTRHTSHSYLLCGNACSACEAYVLSFRVNHVFKLVPIGALHLNCHGVLQLEPADHALSGGMVLAPVIHLNTLGPRQIDRLMGLSILYEKNRKYIQKHIKHMQIHINICKKVEK